MKVPRRGRRPVPAAALFAAVAVVLVALVGLAGACSGSGDEGASSSAGPAGPVVLTVVGDEGEKQFTMDELRALPRHEGYGGMKSSTGRITPPVTYAGVALKELTDQVGGATRENGVTLVAKDGYGMTFSFGQLYEGGFVTYDPATGEEEPADGSLTVLIAYEREGEPLGEDEGPLRLAVVQATPSQVVDGHWAVKWVDRVEVRQAAAEWKVLVEGAESTTIDRASYLNCASPGCHGSGWVDPEEQRWEGVPLYLVCGMVDDENKHDAGAYNAKLARRGYDIAIETADGRVVTLDSRDIHGKRSIVLSSKVDGGELPEEYFPMRLVGPGLEAEQMPGRIVRIVVRVESR